MIKKENLSKEDNNKLSNAFSSQIPVNEKRSFSVEVQAMGNSCMPILITQNEYMRRMKEMSQFQQGMAFYGQMPDSYNIVLNIDHTLIKQILSDISAKTDNELKPINSEIKGQKAREAALQQAQKDKKAEDIPEKEKEDLQNTRKNITELTEKQKQIIANAAKDNSSIHQLIDLALLQNGMLQGKDLDNFIKRSVSMIK